MAFALSGCATTNEVKDIVYQSNAAMLTGGPIDGMGGDNPNWKDEVDRIESFITAHPDADITNAALRVRQGMLLAVFQSSASKAN